MSYSITIWVPNYSLQTQFRFLVVVKRISVRRRSKRRARKAGGQKHYPTESARCPMESTPLLESTPGPVGSITRSQSIPFYCNCHAAQAVCDSSPAYYWQNHNVAAVVSYFITITLLAPSIGISCWWLHCVSLSLILLQESQHHLMNNKATTYIIFPKFTTVLNGFFFFFRSGMKDFLGIVKNFQQLMQRARYLIHLQGWRTRK